MQNKLKVGFFSFTGCEGCIMIMIESLNYKYAEWGSLLEIKYARALKKKNELDGDGGLDVAFIEGAISTFKEENMLRRIRKNAKKVIAIGSCAANGAPSSQRNNFDEKTLAEIKPIMERFGHKEKVTPIGEHVKVDGVVNGCPMDEAAFVKAVEDALLEFSIRKKPEV